MDFITENYLVIILIGLFFVFALIGYLIDMLRNNKVEEKKETIENIKPIEITDITLPKESLKDVIEANEKKELNDADDLLKNYDESITEKE